LGLSHLYRIDISATLNGFWRWHFFVTSSSLCHHFNSIIVMPLDSFPQWVEELIHDTNTTARNVLADLIQSRVQQIRVRAECSVECWTRVTQWFLQVTSVPIASVGSSTCSLEELCIQQQALTLYVLLLEQFVSLSTHPDVDTIVYHVCCCLCLSTPEETLRDGSLLEPCVTTGYRGSVWHFCRHWAALPERSSTRSQRHHGLVNDSYSDQDVIRSISSWAWYGMGLLWQCLDRRHWIRQGMTATTSNIPSWMRMPNDRSNSDLDSSNDDSVGPMVTSEENLVYWSPSIRRACQMLWSDDAPPPLDTALDRIDWQRMSVVFLTLLMQYHGDLGHGDWLRLLAGGESGTSPASLLQRLWSEVERLHDPTMPASKYTDFSLSCLALLACWQQRASDAASMSSALRHQLKVLLSYQLDGFLPQLWRLMFPLRSSSTGDFASLRPRWMELAPDSPLLRPTILRAFWCCCRGSNESEAWHVASPAARAYLEAWAGEAWTALATSSNAWEMYRLYLFHSSSTRFISQMALTSILTGNSADHAQVTEQAASDLLERLVAGSLASTPATALLQDLVEQAHGRSTLHHALGRALSRALNRPCVVEKLTHVVCSEMNQSYTHWNRKTLLDVLHSMVSNDAQRCKSLMESHCLDRLIGLVAPEEKNADETFERSFDCLMAEDDDSDTPPAHNLSKLLDMTAIPMVLTQAVPRPSDPSQSLGLRMAAASVLGTLYSNLVVQNGMDPRTGDRLARPISLLFSRESQVLGSFQGDEHDPDEPDFLWTRRKLRLVRACALVPTSDEAFISMLLLDATRQRARLDHLHRTIKRNEREISEYHIRQQELVTVSDGYARKLSSQSVRFQRELTECQRAATLRIEQSIEVHQTERRLAEKQRLEAQAHVRALEQCFAEAEAKLLEKSNAEELARSKVEEQSRLISKLEQDYRQVLTDQQERRGEIANLTADLASAQEVARNARAREKEVSQKNQCLVDDLSRIHTNEESLRSSLENLFGDMISLAKLYENLEDDVASSRSEETNEIKKYTDLLRIEKGRCAEVTERLRWVEKENKLQAEKYLQLREKLEKEREQWRRKAGDRDSKVDHLSYISHLHRSSSADISSVSSRSRATSPASSLDIRRKDSRQQPKLNHKESVDRRNIENEPSNRFTFKTTDGRSKPSRFGSLQFS
jgi:hypothetical protein